MVQTKVGIIDYGLGNLMSVQNAVEFVGGQAFIVKQPQELSSATHIILPGVGAFGEGMATLNSMGWTDEIHEAASHRKQPLLGICLGMHLLADSSTEHGLHKGLGLISGAVERFKNTKNVRIPHVGWNEVKISENTQTYDQMGAHEDFYFVHSYVFHATDPQTISGQSSHGAEFVSSVEQDNIWGAQYHPEKSQKSGLSVIKNFLGL